VLALSRGRRKVHIDAIGDAASAASEADTPDAIFRNKRR